MKSTVRINHQISAKELRVITEDGENLGVITKEEAMAKAEELGLDLIEISPLAVPPIAKIMDLGKYQYLEQKKVKVSKAKTQSTETKAIQITVGIGEHDLNLKAKKVGEFMKEGHRVKIELFLQGRTKYMDQAFLRERLERILKLIPEEYKVAEEIKRGPKGLTIIVERAKK